MIIAEDLRRPFWQLSVALPLDVLDLLGEVLTPEPAAAPRPAPKATAPSPQAELDEWRRLQAGIAPLKPKKPMAPP